MNFECWTCFRFGSNFCSESHFHWKEKKMQFWSLELKIHSCGFIFSKFFIFFGEFFSHITNGLICERYRAIAQKKITTLQSNKLYTFINFSLIFGAHKCDIIFLRITWAWPLMTNKVYTFMRRIECALLYDGERFDLNKLSSHIACMFNPVYAALNG